MVEQPGESKGDESNTSNTNSRAADNVTASSREAVGPQRQGNTKAAGGKERKACAPGSEGGGGSARAGFVQTL